MKVLWIFLRPAAHPAPGPTPYFRAALFVLLTFGLEYGVMHYILGVDEHKSSVVAIAYQQLLTMTRGRTVEPRFTTVIEFSKEVKLSPRTIAGGSCGFRSYVADVLNQALVYGPRSIVLDMLMDAKSPCPEETAKLVDAAQTACKTLPVTIGYQIDAKSEDRKVLPGYGIGKADLCREGFINPELDIRLVPLIQKIKGTTDPVTSLALASAKAIEPTILKQRTIDWALQGKTSWFWGEPAVFSSMIPKEGFRATQNRIPATAIYLLGQGPSAIDKSLVAALRGKVLVFGSDEEGDEETSAGDMPGYLVQTNYLESILDGRLFWKVPDWMQAIIAFGLWLNLERTQLLGAKLVALFRNILIIFTGNAILANFLGGYGDFALISFAGLLMLIVTELSHRLMGAHAPEVASR